MPTDHFDGSLKNKLRGTAFIIGGILAGVVAWVAGLLIVSYWWSIVYFPDANLSDVLDKLSHLLRLNFFTLCLTGLLPVLVFGGFVVLFWGFFKWQLFIANGVKLFWNNVAIIVIVIFSIVCGFCGGFVWLESFSCC